jgi:hypothetical protein
MFSRHEKMPADISDEEMANRSPGFGYYARKKRGLINTPKATEISRIKFKKIKKSNFSFRFNYISDIPYPAKIHLLHYLEDDTSLTQLSKTSHFWKKQINNYKDCQESFKNSFTDAFYNGDRKRVLDILTCNSVFITIDPIVKAVIEDDRKTLILLLDKDKEKYAINSTFYGTHFAECLIHIAARFDSMNCLKEILAEINNINENIDMRIITYIADRSRLRETALELAVSLKRYPCVQLLLNHGANPLEDYYDRYPEYLNAYDLAIENKDTKMIELMIKIYEDFIKEDDGVTKKDKEILNIMRAGYEKFLSEPPVSPTHNPGNSYCQM